MGNGRNDAGSAVRGSGHNASARGVLFIHSHGKHVHPIHGCERIGAATICKFLGKPRSTPPYIEPTRQDPFGLETALHALSHHFPDAPDIRANFFLASPSLLVFEGDLPNRPRVLLADAQQFVRAGKWVGLDSKSLPLEFDPPAK